MLRTTELYKILLRKVIWKWTLMDASASFQIYTF